MVFGINLEMVIIIFFVLIIILFVVLVFTIRQLQNITRKYYIVMSGKKGMDLEGIILTRFNEMDKVKTIAKKVTKEHRTFKAHLDSCYNKLGITKYNAFPDMAGDQSFSVALLNDENSGIVLSAIHTRDGCYTYLKEIIKGESYIVLSEEEKEALKKAETVDDMVKGMIENAEDITFDID
jgi:hypothetical protein